MDSHTVTKGLPGASLAGDVQSGPAAARVARPSTIKYPPFPSPPPGVTITPFKDYKERGIQIFATDESGLEVDGLGLPTVELGIEHAIDECKTETRRKWKEGKEDAEEQANADTLKEKQTVSFRVEGNAREIPRHLVFSGRTWYDVWAEGEDLRKGSKPYNPNLTAMDRIHIAATDFRLTRPWPPARVKLGYLWDQFRLFAGLLGSIPIWTRTDLPNDEDNFDDDEDDEAELEASLRVEGVQAPWNQPRQGSSDASAGRRPRNPRKNVSDVGDDNTPENDGEDGDLKESEAPLPSAPPQRRRQPARTPYALFNLQPVSVASDEEVQVLLAHAAAEKDAKLIKFLSNIEGSVKVFLSWWLRHEGLIWTVQYLGILPRLIKFWFAFLLRANVLPEYQRDVKRALEITEKAIIELPHTASLCRTLPDVVGKGSLACWDRRAPQQEWTFDDETKTPLDSKERDEAARRQFEAELKAVNVALIDPDEVDHPSVVLSRRGGEVDALELGGEIERVIDDDIKIQVLSPTSPGYVEPLSASLLDDVVIKPPIAEELNAPLRMAVDPSPSTELDESDPCAWRLPTPVGKMTEAEKQAELDLQRSAWVVHPTQPLFEVLGMTTLPLLYEAGVAERSLRRVKAVFKPGENVGVGQKVKGLADELERKFARVVLEPWGEWDDGGVAPDYRVPITFYADGVGHDPLKDDIIILMDNQAASLVCLGMGLAGLWVNFAPKRPQGKGHARTNINKGRYWYVEELSMAIPSFWAVETGDELAEREEGVEALN